MTEPDGAAPTPPTASGEPPPRLAEVLETFKADHELADIQDVNDPSGSRPRLNWDSITDAGGAPPTSGDADKSGFQFDLGGALAKFGLDSEPPAAPPATTGPDVAPVAAPETPAASMPPTVTADPTPASSDSPSALGDPLPRRQGGDPAPAVEPLPTRRTVDTPDPLPTRRAEPRPSVAADPPPAADRSPAAEPAAAHTGTDDGADDADGADGAADLAPRRYVGQRRSVFDEPAPGQPYGSPAPEDPPTRPAAPNPAVAPVLPARSTTGAPTTPAAPTLPVNQPGAAPTLPASGPSLPTLPSAPTLPAPAAPAPMHTPPVDNAPNTPDLNALRSAQLRAARQQKSGRLFGRTLLSLLVLGGLIAAALIFGRDYLFPTKWDPALTPIVDELQRSGQVEFDHEVGLVRQPAEEFALTVGRVVFGDRWVDTVPEWRALGLATGDPSPASIAPELATRRLAVYDADVDRIYLSQDATAESAAADLRVALEQALAAQIDTDIDAQTDDQTAEPPARRLAGVSTPAALARDAIERYLASSAGADSPPAAASGGSLPLPLAYELVAVDSLGEALLVASGVDPSAATAPPPADQIGNLLDDAPVAATPSVLRVGERPITDAVAIGVDDWSLVWGSRLSAATVARMADLVVADSYRPIERSGKVCVVGVFETGSASAATVVLASLTQWAAAGPIESEALASAISDTRLQLLTCDPGSAITTTIDPASAVALVERQIDRLA